jgi:hypothetical protein
MLVIMEHRINGKRNNSVLRDVFIQQLCPHLFAMIFIGYYIQSTRVKRYRYFRRIYGQTGKITAGNTRIIVAEAAYLNTVSFQKTAQIPSEMPAAENNKLTAASQKIKKAGDVALLNRDLKTGVLIIQAGTFGEQAELQPLLLVKAFARKAPFSSAFIKQRLNHSTCSLMPSSPDFRTSSFSYSPINTLQARS